MKSGHNAEVQARIDVARRHYDMRRVGRPKQEFVGHDTNGFAVWAEVI